ncbi:hypothetical protein ASPZODRAFT_14484 [Penicilliopsis zonata CBS 506.65]|uniref:Calcineurin-like phosphoesterase domain-containing protein n=1 Tax=Penicilliopsis zonata CBS 506.65 TaxID=1073090 RepID=A0A1L9SMK2_9EURO|nr:hypothetical protein ASPZODRAFT_14484 [Penicilliopsis zonata CBS 506.65]OJJ48343.1 hypothetical protein ASPZODRAFT_14484 [Penicilliopsis zonata CBS 506.65]
MATLLRDHDNMDVSSDSGSEDGFYPRSSSFHLSQYSRPLIDFVKNEWQTNSKYHYHSASSSPSNTSDAPRWVQITLSLIAAPRFRRYVLVYVILLISCWACWKQVLSPRLEEHAALISSLDVHTKDQVGGWFGTNALPQFDDLVKIRTLDPSLLPSDTKATSGPSQRRLIVVGDVHGCKAELVKLLEKVSFNPNNGDHLIFTGDMINKGPDSLGVVDLARKYSASCVRGNHEDRVLLLRHEMYAANTLTADDASSAVDSKEEFLSTDYQERKLARQLTHDQAKWLDTCPVILKVGQIPDMGQVVVVHAGIVPGVPLEKQDPASVMNMRTIDLDTHVPSSSKSGMPWTKLFNKHQSLLYSDLKESDPDAKASTTTVIYGHDASSSLNLKTYTKGLDSRCVKGGKLTAMVIGDGGESSTVSVKCRNYMDG